jgi:hypothetical protein
MVPACASCNHESKGHAMTIRRRALIDQKKLSRTSRAATNPVASYQAPPHPILHLQRIIGNRGIQRMMQTKQVDHLMDTRSICAASYSGSAAEKVPQQRSGGTAGHGKNTVLRAPPSTSNDCGWLRAKCYYYCTKAHLLRFPPDPSGFSKCKQGCCDWAYNQCQKDGSWPCIFPGM